MNLQEFNTLLAESNPPEDLSLPLQALWHDANGHWDHAHSLAQSAGDKRGAWVHAYLHRKEGDTSNANYWYSRAGQSMSSLPLHAEWEEITRALLQEAPASP